MLEVECFMYLLELVRNNFGMSRPAVGAFVKDGKKSKLIQCI
jgi:hypothetical protein